MKTKIKFKWNYTYNKRELDSAYCKIQLNEKYFYDLNIAKYETGYFVCIYDKNFCVFSRTFEAHIKLSEIKSFLENKFLACIKSKIQNIKDEMKVLNRVKL